MKKTIEGKTLDGEKRVYEFELMDAKTGLRLEYTKFALLIHNEAIVEIIKDKEFKNDLASVRDIILGIYTIDDLEDFAAKMMVGGTVSIVSGPNDARQSWTLDEFGHCEFFAGELPEFVTALFYALCANYPKSTLPLIEAAASPKEDSTPPPTTKKKTKVKK